MSAIVSRVSTSASQEALRESMNKAHKDLSKVVKQQSTEQRSETFAGLTGEVSTETLLRVQNSLDKVDARTKNNTLLQKKLFEQQNAITGLQDVARSALLDIQTTRNPVNINSVDIVNLAKNHLGSIKHFLSAQFNGQFIFSGSKVNENPTGDIVNVSNIDLLNNPSVNYYKGDDIVTTSKISDDHDLDYGIKASDPTIAKLIASLHKAIEAKTTNDPTKYDEAMLWVEQANKELSSMTSKIGSNMRAVESVTNHDKANITQMAEFIKDVQKIDLTETTTKLMEVQAKLQATMMLLTRINSISLADYIK